MKLPDLEAWFDSQDLPLESKIQKWKILNVKLFVKHHVTTLKYNSGNKLFLPYYERLMELKANLEKNN